MLIFLKDISPVIPISKSELVCPIIVNNKVVCILDADSNKINGFDLTDQKTFELICSEIASLFSS